MKNFLKKFILLLLPLLGIMACEKEKEKAIFDIAFSECSKSPDFRAAEVSIECRNGNIYVTHLNAMVNCAFKDIIVDLSVNDNVITIIEKEDSILANCFCSTDISYSIGTFTAGSYSLVIVFHDEVIYEQLIEIRP